MGFFEIVVINLGTAIAKHIIKSWLGDGLPAKIANELISVIKDEGKRKSQTKEQKQVDTIAGEITELMRPLFVNSTETLSQEQRAVVAGEVALTLAGAQIDSDLVIKYGASPERLEKYLRTVRPDTTKLLNRDESYLYERILGEASRAILKVAVNLSGFQLSFAERALYDINEIYESVMKLLSIRDREAEEFEKKFCDAVKGQLDHMEIFGVPRMDELTRRQSLSIAYVSLNVEKSLGDCEPAVRILKKVTLKDVQDAFRETELSEETRASVNGILRLSRRIVIQGQAGSGKSTLLQWIAVRSANEDFPPELATWNNTVPFFIRLREFVDKDFPPPEEFLSPVAPILAGAMPKGWVHTLLEQGRAIIMVDGVDELPKKQRSNMLESLKQLVSCYRLARYIVTSRPNALDETSWPEWQNWIESEGFITATLQDMTTPLVEEFIDHWHTALSATVDDPKEKQELTALPEGLKRQLRIRPPLRNLAVNPLLCAMICSLHRERRQNLPAERLKLYQDCVEMLLNRRDPGRKIQLGDEYPDLGEIQKEKLIQGFAYWLQKNSYSDIEIDAADRHFTKRLELMNLSDLSGTKVRRFFVERTNLLREPISNRIDFTHRTFLEYLAAKEAVDVDEFGLLLKHARNDQWREILILAAGIARPKEREKLLKKLISRGDKLKTPQYKHQMFLLALACLETPGVLEPKVRQEVLDKSITLIPPQDEDQVRMVAKAGDPATYLLKYRSELSAKEIARCVKTLALISTPKAMMILSNYSQDDREFVQRAIGQAWESFERIKYAQTVLRRSEQLYINNLPSWEGFEFLSHITKLEIKTAQVDDWLPLTKLSNLKVLDLKTNEFFDLSLLSRLKELEVLSLYMTDQTLAPLNGLDKLKELNLYGDKLPFRVHLSFNLKITTSMAGCLPLPFPTIKNNEHEELLVRVHNINELSPLHALSHIRKLEIIGSDFDNSESLSGFDSLEYLNISNTKVNNLDTIKALNHLVQLDIAETAIMSIDAVSHLKNLEYLSVKGTDVKELSSLSCLKNLTSLDFSHTEVSDLSSLSKLEGLERLALDNTQVKNLETLCRLKNLKTLSIPAHISDLRPLTELGNLRVLDIIVSTPSDFSLGFYFLFGWQIEIPPEGLLVRIAGESDLSHLNVLDRITCLDISLAIIQDFTPLAQLSNLKTLVIREGQEIDSILVEELEIVQAKEGRWLGAIDFISLLKSEKNSLLPRLRSFSSVIDNVNSITS